MQTQEVFCESGRHERSICTVRVTAKSTAYGKKDGSDPRWSLKSTEEENGTPSETKDKIRQGGTSSSAYCNCGCS